MRGEHRARLLIPQRHKGSSPHARGAQCADALGCSVSGIIPACAGSTSRRKSGSAWPRDHPRMRGEHTKYLRASIPWSGSSPHARGAPARTVQSRQQFGIIPACAGSTQRRPYRRQSIWDHPRMRGEHIRTLFASHYQAGSSPHARGAPKAAAQIRIPDRIIPACAGSTACSQGPFFMPRDHPRMRGEHSRIAGTSSADTGSSPHARGAHAPAATQSPARRIIPACAGSTGTYARSPLNSRDHPRMRGEHFGMTAKTAISLGSSPHARGARMSSLPSG